MAIVLVMHVMPWDADIKLDEEDKLIIGAYQITLTGDVGTEQYADAALDIFHSNIAINNLDDFRFEITCNGEQLEPNPEYAAYALSESGTLQRIS